MTKYDQDCDSLQEAIQEAINLLEFDSGYPLKITYGEEVIWEHHEEEFDGILIRQKDYILQLINKRKFSEAQQCLNVLTELWKDTNYEYKLRELTQRIQEQKVSKV